MRIWSFGCIKVKLAQWHYCLVALYCSYFSTSSEYWHALHLFSVVKVLRKVSEERIRKETSHNLSNSLQISERACLWSQTLIQSTFNSFGSVFVLNIWTLQWRVKVGSEHWKQISSYKFLVSLLKRLWTWKKLSYSTCFVTNSH